jgi:hypothetical protein
LRIGIRQVRTALKNDDLWFGLRRWRFDDIWLHTWIDECETTAGRDLTIPHDHGPGEYERLAASLALLLMRKYDRPVTTTKGREFERLTAILAGRPKGNFHHYCREAVAAK